MVPTNTGGIVKLSSLTLTRSLYADQPDNRRLLGRLRDRSAASILSELELRPELHDLQSAAYFKRDV